MYKNISASLGTGFRYNYSCVSSGIRVYNSGCDSGDRLFGGLNYIHSSLPESKTDGNSIQLIAGYRHTFPCGIFMSPYAGIGRAEWVYKNDHSFCTDPVYGLNIGYQFNFKPSI